MDRTPRGRVSQNDREQRQMEKVRPWCGQPSDRGRLKNLTEQGYGYSTVGVRASYHRFLGLNADSGRCKSLIRHWTIVKQVFNVFNSHRMDAAYFNRRRTRSGLYLTICSLGEAIQTRAIIKH